MDTRRARQIIEELKDNYDELARDFSNTRAHLWHEFQDLIQYVKNSDRILDLGCGNGRLYELFKDRPISYIGADNSSKLIAEAKQLRPVTQWQSPQFLVADALELPFSDQEFNIIFSIAVLHHIPSEDFRQQFIQNCYRLLKPGGRLILTIWNFWQPRLLIRYKIWPIIFGWHKQGLDRGDIMIPWKMQLSKTKTPDGVPCLGESSRFKIIQRYYHAFTAPELSKLIQRAGFKIEKKYYVRRGQRTNRLNGYNLVIIAYKVK